MYEDTRGAYFGGLQNVTVTDLSDIPEPMEGMERVAAAADRAMESVLSSDLITNKITEKDVRDFVNIEVTA